MEERKDEILIRMKDVGMEFEGKTILERVNFTLKRNDFLAISGPNGGGKTTFLRILLKLLKPTSGNVEYFHNEGICNRLAIGYLPQKSMIDTRFPISVKQVVLSGLRSGWLGRLPKDAEQRFADAAALCGFGNYESQSIGTLSGGQLQRVLMGRALISNPEILVLDEPLSYVDKTFEHRLYELIEHLSHHKTIVLVSHEMKRFSQSATRELVIDRNVREFSSHFMEAEKCWRP